MYRDLQAQRAKDTYDGWLVGLRGVFALALEAPDPTTRQSRNAFMARAKALGVLTIDRLREQARQIAADHDLPQDSVQFAIEQVKAQVTRDVSIAAESLRKLALEIQFNKGVKENFTTALIRACRNRVTDLRFEYVDRSGKKWSGSSYIKTVFRHLAVDLDVVKSMEVIALAGSDLARLSYLDDAHENNGLIFSISGSTSGVPSYWDLKEAGLFHPNTNVKVVPA